ncbi:hypothetical protein D9611_000602 [Ephemerocybe angulata]|uniref:Uncharacterized protein n=1 Tax=Ephemerocybe angulata TaxID=980116 RepID=A0A8H5BMW5_9AGAR|nr:hypothetical protein D9611_000602 [Tulosesus angulatus]
MATCSTSTRSRPLTCGLSTIEKFLLLSSNSLRNQLFLWLSKPDIVQLSCASSILKEYATIYSEGAWNINTFLEPWFQPPTIFRGVMAVSGAVVSGSQALRFFDRQSPNIACDLDIYVRLAGAMTIIVYLLESGYRRDVQLRGGGYPLLSDLQSLSTTKRFCSGGGPQGLLAVFDFDKPGPGSTMLKAQVIVLAQDPIHHVLHNFHSTLVMNFITYREAVAIFPRTTFLKRVGYISSRRRIGDIQKPMWRTKYEKRGFTFDTQSLRPSIELAARSLGDSRCWTILFKDLGRHSVIGLDATYSIYRIPELDKIKFDLSWIPEGGLGHATDRFRLGIYEPELWDYIYPWHILR